jgi:prephenate dehydrogenase
VSEAPPEILILGLQEVGASIGLALRRGEVPARIVGSDPQEKTARAALQAGAIEHIAPAGVATRSANLIILAMPRSEAQAYLEMAAERSSLNAVILDTAPGLAKRLAWVETHLPAGRFYLGGVPSLTASALQSPPSEPSADLFQGSTLAVVLPRGTPEEVAGLGPQFARVLGCEPFFIDPAELDGVEAAAEALPRLAWAALLRTASQAANWRETSRLAGRPLALLGATLTGEDPRAVAEELHRNRTNVLSKLEDYRRELDALQVLLERPQPDGLAAHLTALRETYTGWLSARARADWRVADSVPAPTEDAFGGFLSRLLLPRSMRGQKPRR